jgi:hypothetical protein
MYLARHLGGWSTTVIGRFYSGRDHSTVCHGIQKIESLRENNPDLDLLISDLKRELGDIGASEGQSETRKSDRGVRLSRTDLGLLADMIAARIFRRLAEENGNVAKIEPDDIA